MKFSFQLSVIYCLFIIQGCVFFPKHEMSCPSLGEVHVFKAGKNSEIRVSGTLPWPGFSSGIDTVVDGDTMTLKIYVRTGWADMKTSFISETVKVPKSVNKVKLCSGEDIVWQRNK